MSIIPHLSSLNKAFIGPRSQFANDDAKFCISQISSIIRIIGDVSHITKQFELPRPIADFSLTVGTSVLFSVRLLSLSDQREQSAGLSYSSRCLFCFGAWTRRSRQQLRCGLTRFSSGGKELLSVFLTLRSTTTSCLAWGSTSQAKSSFIMAIATCKWVYWNRVSWSVRLHRRVGIPRYE